LSLADRDPQLRGGLAVLWRQVLNGADYAENATGVLERWARMLDPDDRGTAVLGRLARAIGDGHPRTRQLLLRQAAMWTSTRNLDPTPRAAEAVRVALATRKDGP